MVRRGLHNRRGGLTTRRASRYGKATGGEERPPRYVGNGGKTTGGLLGDGLAGNLRRPLFLIMGDGGVHDRPAVDALPSVDNQEIVGKKFPDNETFAFPAF